MNYGKTYYTHVVKLSLLHQDYENVHVHKGKIKCATVTCPMQDVFGKSNTKTNESAQFQTATHSRVSLSEPHINNTAVCKLYFIIIMAHQSHEIIYSAWLYGHKHEIFYYAF